MICFRSAILFAFLIVGCSSSPTGPAPLSIPTAIQLEGRTWTKADLSAKNRKALDRYFRQHPELRDHPNLSGELVLYTDGHGARRFYWILPARGGHSWMLLEQDQRFRFAGKIQEGTGHPFQ